MVKPSRGQDDDRNFHMDFIRSFANLRARNYSIEEVDALQVLTISISI
jgi:hypothetical protein